jgi:hypothetical protein
MKILSLLALALPLCAQVTVTQQKDRIAVQMDGKPFTEFIIGGTNKPFLYPLRAASGTIVTRGYPLDKDVPGEAHDHPHQKGLWFSHGNVNGFDFWSNEPFQKESPKGTIVLDKVKSIHSGKKEGSINASFYWLDANGNRLLREDRTMVFHDDPKLRIIDFDIDLKALQKVTFGDTKEGTFAMRIAAPLEEPGKENAKYSVKRTGKMVSSEGKEYEKEIWGKRANWVDYDGEINGEKLGIAIFDNPANPGHPTHWHARGYGLFAANIFGLHDFYNDKSKSGAVTVEPGQDLRFRYRVVIHPGDATSAGIADLYKQYAAGK